MFVNLLAMQLGIVVFGFRITTRLARQRAATISAQARSYSSPSSRLL